jgi:hypothetical protein
VEISKSTGNFEEKVGALNKTSAKIRSFDIFTTLAHGNGESNKLQY